jgi:hypothetical protein
MKIDFIIILRSLRSTKNLHSVIVSVYILKMNYSFIVKESLQFVVNSLILCIISNIKLVNSRQIEGQIFKSLIFKKYDSFDFHSSFPYQKHKL